MADLQIIVATAGRSALVNAQNTGTAPVLMAQIGVTATAFTGTAATAALPGEIKRLATFAGVVVADDTIHITIRDDSADVYTMRGFALYLGDGTLFASYGQAGAILEKSAQAMLLLSADIKFVDVLATSLSFGDASFVNPTATTEVTGVVELATSAEVTNGTDTQRAVTPAGLKAATDTRFGAAAPTAFVKTLLALTTAALIRTALELKSASLKDEGSGNGLDADTLDGQDGDYYLEWGNLAGIPSAFAPSAHGHVWGDISGKPLTFAPSAHGHAIGEINSLFESLAERALLTGAAFSGTVSAPTFAPPGSLRIVGSNNGLGATEQMIEFAPSRWLSYSNAADRYQFNGRIEVIGSVTASGGFQNGSSRELKTALRRMPYGLAEINRIETKVGRYKNKFNSDGRNRLFVIAEQLAGIVPEAVFSDAVEMGGKTFSAVEYSQLVPVLIRAVQELSAQVRALQDR